MMNLKVDNLDEKQICNFDYLFCFAFAISFLAFINDFAFGVFCEKHQITNSNIETTSHCGICQKLKTKSMALIDINKHLLAFIGIYQIVFGIQT